MITATFPCLIALADNSPIIPQPAAAMLTPLLALDLQLETLIPIVAIVGGLSLAAVIVVAGIISSTKKRQMWHDTARLAIEKGQPLPPMPRTDEELENTPPPGVSLADWETVRLARERQGNIKAGLILIAVGIGLYVMLHGQGAYASAIPGFIGVALLLNAVLTRPTVLPPSPRPPSAP
jgi:hypothetical protein